MAEQVREELNDCSSYLASTARTGEFEYFQTHQQQMNALHQA
jgi:hypothetical protein